MRTKFYQPKFGSDVCLLTAAKVIYGNLKLSAEHVQTLVVELVTRAQDMSKKEIMDKEGDIYQTCEFLFKDSPKGMDRGTLSAWFVAYTPIRPRFKKGNAHYDGLGFARDPKWDLKGATDNKWYDEDPESTRTLSKPDIDKQVELLAIQMAKLAHLESGNISKVVKMAMDKLDNLEQIVKEKYMTDKVIAFRDEYRAQEEARKLAS